MKQFFGRLRHNTGMKLIALFFAILTWSFVISTDDPLRSRTVKDVPIDITGLAELEEKGLIVRGDLEQIFEDVQVVVDVRVSEANRLNATVVDVRADLSSITRKGEYTIYLSATTAVGDVVSVRPASLKLEVEERITRTVPVSAAFKGTLSSELYHEEPVLSQSQIEITGARSDVERVRSAVCQIDLSKVSESIHSSYNLILLDEAGEVVPSDSFVSELPAVTVQMAVLGKKTVPISTDIQLCLQNPQDVAAGYAVAGISFTPQTVELVGDAKVLETMDVVGIELIRLSGDSTTRTHDVKLSLPDGVQLLGQAPIKMTVYINAVNTGVQPASGT